MRFELTREFLEQIRLAIQSEDTTWIKEHVVDLHFADIAEIIDELSMKEAKVLYYQLDEDLQADVLMELEEEVRDRFVASLDSKELAEQLENLDSDDAADILGELPEEKVQEVISQMEDDDAADDIVDLLNYDEDTAGGLMQKEFIQARLDWPVNRAIVELRRQAEDVEKVYTIYVVDDLNKLVGVLSLKRLLFASPKTPIRELYQAKNLISVKTSDSSEMVAKVMEKYDLVSIPVVDLQSKLVGRITIDDVVDVIKEEADKDFQLASGISEKVESNSSVWRLSRARLPWLIIGMMGGLFSALVISKFEGNISSLPALAFFIPLITAMGGNVGVQSSAIVVQSLARGNDPFDSILTKVAKEALVGIVNGLLCSALIFAVAYFANDFGLALTVSFSLLTVIIFAAIFGTMIPLILNRYKIRQRFVNSNESVLSNFLSIFTIAAII